MLLAVPFIPHHHHDKALCTVVERCDNDNTDNDEHTGHNDDSTACIEDGGLFVSKSDVHNNTSYKIIPAFVYAIAECNCRTIPGKEGSMRMGRHRHLPIGGTELDQCPAGTSPYHFLIPLINP